MKRKDKTSNALCAHVSVDLYLPAIPKSKCPVNLSLYMFSTIFFLLLHSSSVTLRDTVAMSDISIIHYKPSLSDLTAMVRCLFAFFLVSSESYPAIADASGMKEEIRVLAVGRFLLAVRCLDVKGNGKSTGKHLMRVDVSKLPPPLSSCFVCFPFCVWTLYPCLHFVQGPKSYSRSLVCLRVTDYTQCWRNPELF